MREITLLDGATGTRLWELAEAAGAAKVSTWRYNVEHPELVTEAEREYIDAGSQIILTNTFNANRLEVGPASGYTVEQVVSGAVKAAKAAAAGTDVKVALDIGPLSQLLEPYGDLEADEASDIFAQMLTAGVEAGADLVFIETFMDLAMMRLAAQEAKRYFLPVFCSMTFSKGGRTMFGDSVGDTVAALEALDIDAVGLNCSLGPDLAAPIIREFASLTKLPLIFKPNAGMPALGEDGQTRYGCSAADFVRQSEEAFRFASYIGGCCGTDASYIRALRKRLLN